MQLLKRILSLIAYVIGIIVLFLIAVTVLLQTQFFRDRLRSLLVSTISQNINGRLQLGTLRGDFITGVSIDYLKLYYGDSLCISSGPIHLVYDPLALFEKKIILKEATIDSPSIQFFRPASGGWNIINLFQVTKDTARAAPFDWTIIVDKLELKHGRVRLLDSLSLTMPDHDRSAPQFLEYHNFAAHDINVALHGTYQQDDLEVQIEGISFFLQAPQFRLINLQGNIHTSEKGLTLNNLTLLTDRSSLAINGHVAKLNILKGIDLEKLEYNVTNLSLSAHPLDFTDLKTFLEPVYFLNGVVNLDLDVAGRFGDLAVRQLNLRTYSSNFNLTGVLVNLHTPEKLALDVYFSNSNLTPSDASKLLPPFGIPPFESMGTVNFTAHYIGKPLDFSSVVSLKGSFGNIELDGSLRLTTEQPEYMLKFSTSTLDIAPFTDNKSLSSSLFTHGEIKGRGFSPRTMTADFKTEIDSAFIRNTTLNNSEIGIHAEGGQFDISALLRGPEMNLTTETTLDFSDPALTKFQTEFSLYSVDLEKIFNNNDFQSDISGSGTASGSGTSLSNLSLNADIELDPSTIRSYTSDEEHLRINLDQKNENSKHLSIQTSFADLELSGKFNFEVLSETFPRFVSAFERSITTHLNTADSVPTHVSSNTITPSEKEEFHFAYSVNIKNLEKISNIIGKMPFDGSGTIEGTVKGTQRALSFSSTANVNELFVGNIKEGLLVDKGTLNAQLNNISLENTLQSLWGTTSFRANAFVFNQLRFDNVAAQFELNKETSILDFNGTLDSAYEISTLVTIAAEPKKFNFTIPTFIVKKNSHSITNSDTVRCVLSEQKFLVEKADFRSDSVQIILNGVIGDSQSTDFQISVKNAAFSDMRNWFETSKAQESLEQFGGTFDATMTITQTIADPVILAYVTGNNIHYKQTLLGSSSATLYYANENARLDIKIKRAIEDTLPFLSVSGTLPIRLSLDAEEERFPDRQQRLQIISNGFELALLEPLLSDFDNLSGTATCNMLITGTPRAPKYEGKLSLHNGKFLFLPNYIRYTLSGDLEPHQDKIVLKNFILRTAPEEKIATEATLSGTLTMKDFRVEAFDIDVRGDLLLMTEATRRRLSTMYGTLHTATDETGLHISGNAESPYLVGTLRIKEASLVFPPTKEYSSNSALLLPPLIIDDTSKAQQKQATFIERFYAVADTLTDTTLKEKFTIESPLLSRLRYNLIIETEGETQIRMIFAQATNEELYAELDGRINAVNNSGTPSIYGQITVLNRSYYNFLKRFEASGKLKFVGQWDNPELDIDAVYRGTRIPPSQSTSIAGSSGAKSTTSNEQTVLVYLDITGTRYQPRLEMSMKIQEGVGKEPIDYASVVQSGDVQADAISFILTGKFRDELTSSDKENIAESWGTTAGTGLTSTFLSTVLTNFLQKEFSFIRSAELTYKGGNLQETADLRLSGVAGKGYWRFGGKIFNNLGNANVSYQLSLGEVLNAPSMRNLFIELERKVEGTEFVEESRKLTNTARMYYRISF